MTGEMSHENYTREGKKLPDHLECPIDVHHINSCRSFFPLFRATSLTANHLTGLSFLFGLVAIGFLWQGHYLLTGVCLYIGYLFDCCDGNYARQYNEVSEAGDMFDHFSDLFVYSSVGLLLAYQGHYWFLLGYLVLAILAIWQLSLQECHHQKTSFTFEPLMALIRKMEFTPEMCRVHMKTARYFGTGTAMALITLGFVVLHFTQ